MPTLLDYRRRIRSVKSTQQITRAMKFVAAAKLRRAQEGVFAARPYAKEILRVLRSAAARMESPAHPLLQRRPEEKILVMVLTGDRSLCGAFNSNVLRHAMDFIREHHTQKLELIVVGKKGRDTLRKRGFSFVAEYLDVSAKVEFSKAKEIAARVAELYTSGEVDAVYAIYNEFKNVMVQNLRAEKLLPVDPEVVKKAADGEELASPSRRPRRLPAHRTSARRPRPPGGLHLRAAGRTNFQWSRPALPRRRNFPHPAGIRRRRTRRAHDRHGFSNAQCIRPDRKADAADEQYPPGSNYQGTDRNRKRRSIGKFVIGVDAHSRIH